MEILYHVIASKEGVHSVQVVVKELRHTVDDIEGDRLQNIHHLHVLPCTQRIQGCNRCHSSGLFGKLQCFTQTFHTDHFFRFVVVLAWRARGAVGVYTPEMMTKLFLPKNVENKQHMAAGSTGNQKLILIY